MIPVLGKPAQAGVIPENKAEGCVFVCVILVRRSVRVNFAVIYI